MNNSNAMDIDIIAGQNQNINDYMIALLTQQQELELSGMNPQYISNLEKKLREYQQNNGTENDEEIARLLQENFIKEQEMINALGGNDQNLGMIPKSNSNKVDVNLINYHNSELQRQYRQRHNKEKLSHEYFRSKLNSNEALPIKKQVRDFYIDFEQKSKNVFQSPEEQCQYLRYFLFVIRTLK